MSCNSNTFAYEGSEAALYVIISLNLVVFTLLLLKMCKLCSIAFSYSNFHIHQTYKFYALTMISIAIVLASRIVQMEYKDIQDQNPDVVRHSPSPSPSPGLPPGPDIKSQIEGYRIMNEIIGVISVFSSNYVFLLNAFTWLMIALGCDFTINRESNSQILMNGEQEDLGIQKQSLVGIRKKIRITKKFLLYVLMPLLMLASVFGTLKQTDAWCIVTKQTLIASTAISLVLFIIAVGKFFINRYKDPLTSLATKITLIYLAVSMLIRQVYFIVLSSQEAEQYQNDWLSIAYVIGCQIGPVIGMAVLAQTQLQKEKCALLKGSQIRNLNFRSIVEV